MINVPEIFGSLVFNDDVMKERLPEDIYKSLHKTIEDGRDLDTAVANAVASAMKDWAIEKGATHFTHWFQPMTGITAEKHDSFITPADKGGIIMDFSGKELIKGEPDASSFPSGGLRATFEARGYTAWDPTSYAFIKDSSLCIPTIFCSYSGQVLDKKTPLLRSVELISAQALRMVKLFGYEDVTRVSPTVGPEQEYFLIDKKDFSARKDLRFTGRTLFGAKPPKGQELDDHYFGAIRPRVKAYMRELNEELWKLGILAKTEHNEAAPAQHELAPIFTNTNTATDHNQLTMEIMKKVAHKHGLVCLQHEKPFEGINGSGKHNNWSLNTNTGMNVFKPGKDPRNNKLFLLFLCAVIKAVDEYQDLMRISVASPGNDHRLGAHEAPPAIVSIFLGDELTDILESIKSGSEYLEHKAEVMETGVHVLPDFMKDTTDRNRTSPLAFTGNKFEFRMLGSSNSVAGPNIIMNTIVADALDQFADILEQADDFESALDQLMKDTLRKHDRIIFNGNNYADEWIEEAERRGLLNLRTTVDALEHYLKEKNVSLFTRHSIFTQDEMRSRYEIQLENYSKLLNIEALTMLEMSKREIIPAVSAFISQLTKGAVQKKTLGISLKNDADMKLAERCSDLLNVLYDNTEILARVAAESVNHKDSLDKAVFFKDIILPAMDNVRAIADELETLVSKEYWPFPTYGDLLFYGE